MRLVPFTLQYWCERLGCVCAFVRSAAYAQGGSRHRETDAAAACERRMLFSWAHDANDAQASVATTVVQRVRCNATALCNRWDCMRCNGLVAPDAVAAQRGTTQPYCAA